MEVIQVELKLSGPSLDAIDVWTERPVNMQHNYLIYTFIKCRLHLSPHVHVFWWNQPDAVGQKTVNGLLCIRQIYPLDDE